MLFCRLRFETATAPLCWRLCGCLPFSLPPLFNSICVYSVLLGGCSLFIRSVAPCFFSAVCVCVSFPAVSFDLQTLLQLLLTFQFSFCVLFVPFFRRSFFRLTLFLFRCGKITKLFQPFFRLSFFRFFRRKFLRFFSSFFFNKKNEKRKSRNRKQSRSVPFFLPKNSTQLFPFRSTKKRKRN